MASRSLRAAAALALLALAACETSPPYQDEQSYLQTDDEVLLHYRRMGRGEEVLIVLGESWLAEDLGRLTRDRTVVFYDLRGRGLSPTMQTPNSLARDLADLEGVQEWFGFERVSLLGTGYEAALAAHYALAHPERVERLVMVTPITMRKNPYQRIYERVFNDRLSSEGFGELRKLRVEGLPNSDPQAWAQAYKKHVLTAWVVDPRSLDRMRSNPLVKPNLDPERTIRRHLNLLLSLGDWDWRESMSGVQCPTLVVYGDADLMPSASNEEWVSSIPGARSFVVRGASRLPWIEQPSQFNSAVEGFLGGS